MHSDASCANQETDGTLACLQTIRQCLQTMRPPTCICARFDPNPVLECVKVGLMP